ncbi:MAG: hypothetical protein GF308_20130 [Candidatus Heimdallarchaeota archaeon]|nr:hypothetical protein [Candidatus Heimdallarchaeota archaeon]
MFEVLEKCLHTTTVNQANLVQLRGQERVMTICTLKNGLVEEFSKVSLSGVGTRVLTDECSWGFSSTNIVDFDNVNQSLQNAVKLAKAASGLKSEKITLEPSKAIDEEVVVSPDKPIQDLSMEELVEIPLEAYKGVKAVGDRIKNSVITYISIDDEKYFLSSEEVHLKQKLSRVMLFVNVIAKSNGVTCPASENYGHSGGLELFDKKSPYVLGEQVGKKAVQLLEAKAPPAGKFQVVIHPTLCATLLHEALGHPLEADLAMAGGGFSDRIGELVSSELATIYDSGQISGGLGYFPFDDEGIECKRTVLIENGILKSYLHDRTSAAISNTSPTGNSHAWDYSVEPLIRQTNIGLEAGTFTQEEMIEDIKEGLFLTGTFGGQANVSGDFTFGFQSANWIRKGELAEELRGANVAGNAIEVFKTIDAIGREAVLRPGACGKFQFAVQGRVAPAIRCKIMVGGAGE